MFKKIKKLLKGLHLNAMSAGIIALAVSIFFLAAALSTFTIQVALFRRDIPKNMDRLDRQITALQFIVGSAEASGQEFSSGLNQDITKGINKGMSEGLIDLPVNSVKVVGGKIENTVASTGKHAYNFWEGTKEKMFFWQKKTATREAENGK
jgi:hypothetical protein